MLKKNQIKDWLSTPGKEACWIVTESSKIMSNRNKKVPEMKTNWD